MTQIVAVNSEDADCTSGVKGGRNHDARNPAVFPNWRKHYSKLVKALKGNEDLYLLGYCNLIRFRLSLGVEIDRLLLR